MEFAVWTWKSTVLLIGTYLIIVWFAINLKRVYVMRRLREATVLQLTGKHEATNQELIDAILQKGDFCTPHEMRIFLHVRDEPGWREDRIVFVRNSIGEVCLAPVPFEGKRLYPLEKVYPQAVWKNNPEPELMSPSRFLYIVFP